MMWLMYLLACGSPCDCEADIHELWEANEELRTLHDDLAYELRQLRREVEAMEVPDGLSVSGEPKCTKVGEEWRLPDPSLWHDLTTMPHQARTAWAQDGSAVEGLRLTGLRSNSLLASCGVSSGDTLIRFAGVELTSTVSLMDAHQAANKATEMIEAVIRRGDKEWVQRYHPFDQP